jgi:hypothetical protein
MIFAVIVYEALNASPFPAFGTLRERREGG